MQGMVRLVSVQTDLAYPIKPDWRLVGVVEEDVEGATTIALPDVAFPRHRHMCPCVRACEEAVLIDDRVGKFRRSLHRAVRLGQVGQRVPEEVFGVG